MQHVQGTAGPGEAHNWERLLLEDPLLAEAAEGMRMPGALEGAAHLDRARPVARSGGGWRWILGVVALLSVAVSFHLVTRVAIPAHAPVQPTAPGQNITQHEPVVEEQDQQGRTVVLDEAAFKSVVDEPFRKPAPATTPPVDRSIPTERLTGRQVGPAVPDGPSAKPVRAPRANRQLHYLHDLKIIHPREIHPPKPVQDVHDRHVPAQDAAAQEARKRADEQRYMDYLAFMDVALGHVARNDHARGLEELRFLLDQYPEDVNALFYAGLCSYHLDKLAAARRLLHGAATHAVDVFEEEATWYHALTLDALGETEAAREAFGRIVASEGFYAERAKERLR
jgi:hypothetical protein